MSLSEKDISRIRNALSNLDHAHNAIEKTVVDSGDQIEKYNTIVDISLAIFDLTMLLRENDVLE